MATANKVIEYVDRLKPNAYGEEEKFQWLCDLDGMIRRVVMQEDDGVDYRYPADMDTPLLVPHPWEDIYSQYMITKIDLNNRDYNSYNNNALVFDSTFSEFKKAYIRDHMPKGHGTYRNAGW